MGWTRSRRYANHASGKKYSDTDKENATKTESVPEYFDEKNRKHFVKTKTKKVLPQEEDALVNEKAESARIFYAKYKQANDDPEYRKLRKEWKERYG